MARDERRLRRRLRAGRVGASDARHTVKAALQDWDLDELTDDALLCTSELVTNAVVHTTGEVELVVERRPEVVRVEVHDRSAALPTRKLPSSAAPSGRGLGVVSALSRAWGTERVRGSGKTVWFELATA